MKREDLLFALNETTHALRFIESAAKRFQVDIQEVEAASETATVVAYVKNRLSDAQVELSAAVGEIRVLLEREGSR